MLLASGVTAVRNNMVKGEEIGNGAEAAQSGNVMLPSVSCDYFCTGSFLELTAVSESYLPLSIPERLVRAHRQRPMLK